MREPEPGASSEIKSDDQGVAELLSIGDMEQAAANYESAIRTYRHALEKSPEPILHVRALKSIGTGLERIGRWREALSVLEEGAALARRTEGTRDLGPILVKIGKIRLGQGEIEPALALGREALEVIDAKADPSSRGFALNLLGYAHTRQGNLEKSAACFREALAAFKGAGDIRSLSLAYNNLGLIAKELCEWQRAVEYLQVAANLQAIEGDYPERRGSLHNLGLVFFKMGQWERARECFAEALGLARDVNDPVSTIRILIGSAGLDLVERRWEGALESLEQALELCSEEQYPRELALIYRSLAQLHQVRGEHLRARRCLDVAWRKAVEIAPEGDLARELLRLRADLALAEGQPTEAANLAERALEISTQAGDRMETALAHVSLGRVRQAQGLTSWRESMAKAKDLLRRLGSPFPLVQTLIEEARLSVACGERLAEAETALREALQLLPALDLPETRVEALVLAARVASRRGQLDQAGEYLDGARAEAVRVPKPGVGGLLADVQKEIEEQLVEASVANLGAFRTAGRLEEIVDSRKPYTEKLSGVLEVLAQTAGADGAAIAFESGLVPGATYRMGSGPAEVLAQTLAQTQPDRPAIVLDAETSVPEPWRALATARRASSFLVVPVYGHGRGTIAWLYMDRLIERQGPSFGPSHLNLCLALGPQLRSLADRAALEVATPGEEDSLLRRTYLADVVTQNPEMFEILKLADKVNRTDLTVLLQGETGTGKTLLAKAIHLSSDRAAGPFMTVDCAALTETLLESELFGYVKGAFTGASHDKKGMFEEADGGTIFLDEVGKAGLGVQRRLLHLLDKGEVRPVGSNTYRKLNVRVICATSKKDLLDERDDPFIKDLYYRLNDIIIRVPPLRDRPEDIPLLAEYFLALFNGQTGRSVPEFSRSAMQRLVRYLWPGNVRELEKVVRRAAILVEDGELIGPDLLPKELLEATESFRPAKNGSDAPLRASVKEMERKIIQEALERNRGNLTRTARDLGLSRKGLRNKIERYDLTPPRP